MQGLRGCAKEHEALKGYMAEMQEKARQFHPLTEEDLKATGTHRHPGGYPRHRIQSVARSADRRWRG